MITGDQLLCHAFGDYVIQSHYMAVNKTRSRLICLYHAATYAAPFVCLTWSPLALAAIVGSHFVIDHWRLARFLVAFKNLFLCSQAERERLSFELDMSTGYPNGTPDWLAVWLMIAADNCLHVLCNGLAIKYL